MEGRWDQHCQDASTQSDTPVAWIRSSSTVRQPHCRSGDLPSALSIPLDIHKHTDMFRRPHHTYTHTHTNVHSLRSTHQSSSSAPANSCGCTCVYRMCGSGRCGGREAGGVHRWSAHDGTDVGSSRQPSTTVSPFRCRSLPQQYPFWPTKAPAAARAAPHPLSLSSHAT